MSHILSYNLTIGVPSHFSNLFDLAEDLERGCLNDIDERVWEIARGYQEMPLFCNIYIGEIFLVLESVIQSKYEHLGLDIDWYINSLDSHFYINSTEIQDWADFYELIDEMEREYQEIA